MDIKNKNKVKKKKSKRDAHKKHKKLFALLTPKDRRFFKKSEPKVGLVQWIMKNKPDLLTA